MAVLKRAEKQSTERVADVVEETAPKDSKAEKLKADLDSILDEIDDVLEENAEEFVSSYVQKGGE